MRLIVTRRRGGTQLRRTFPLDAPAETAERDAVAFVAALHADGQVGDVVALFYESAREEGSRLTVEALWYEGHALAVEADVAPDAPRVGWLTAWPVEDAPRVRNPPTPSVRALVAARRKGTGR